MAWRGVHISQAARLSLADGQLQVEQGGEPARLPLEDIAWVVIDTPQVTFTSALASACMEAGIAVMVTDSRHTPSGLLLPFHRHHRQAEVMRLQVEASLPLKKRLWQRIVQAKIMNQANVLSTRGQGGQAMLAMAARVGSGDPDNIEARAAAHYFRRLFADFVRQNGDDRRNMLLNYGYAVQRASVARALVAAGLLPGFGLQHASITNSFNLADDLLEPFRPFVDRAVWEMTSQGTAREGEPTLAERRELAALPTQDCRAGEESVSLLIAAERAAASLVRAFEGNSPAVLQLPVLWETA